MMKSRPEVITCKAGVIWNSGEALKVEEIRVEAPKSNEVRIKMLYASLCHTDILCCNGVPLPLFPRIPGHEGVGQVESVGQNVQNVKEGDIVMPLYLGECKECENCRSGKTNLCHKYPLGFSGVMPTDNTSRMSTTNGHKIYHHFSCSTWSEYIVIDSNFILKVHPDLPLVHASFLCCGFTTGFGAAWKEANVEKGSTVAVLGLGAVGLGAIAGARSEGAAKIIGVDINERKCEKGKSFGMTDFINPKDSDKSVSELVKDLTGGLGVDYCIECTGVASMLNEATEATKVGVGKVVLVSAGIETSGIISLVHLLLGRTVKGCIYGGVRIRSDLPRIIDKCVNKEIELEELLTHQVSINEINEALQLMKDPDCVKIVIKF